jgi:hypothetical protein
MGLAFNCGQSKNIQLLHVQPKYDFENEREELELVTG